jgi:hypothetical protein
MCREAWRVRLLAVKIAPSVCILKTAVNKLVKKHVILFVPELVYE